METNDKWKQTSKTEKTYDAKGNLVSVIYKNLHPADWDGTWVETSKSEYEYDEVGHRIVEKEFKYLE